MKKTFGLTLVTAVVSLCSYAQETLPENSNRIDTFPKNNSNWKKDTTSMEWKNRQKRRDTSSMQGNKQWEPDSMKSNRNMHDPSIMPHHDILDSSTFNKKETSVNIPANNGDTSTGSYNNGQNNASAKHGEGNYNKERTKTSSTVTSDRIIMREGSMFLLKNGETMPLETTYKLESGILVMTDGSVKYPDGRIIKLKNGQFIELKSKTKKTEMNSSTNTTTKKVNGKTVSTTKKKTTY